MLYNCGSWARTVKDLQFGNSSNKTNHEIWRKIIHRVCSCNGSCSGSTLMLGSKWPRTRLMFIFLFMVGNLCKDSSKREFYPTRPSFTPPITTSDMFGFLSDDTQIPMTTNSQLLSGQFTLLMFKAGFPHMPFRKSQILPFIRQVLGYR